MLKDATDSFGRASSLGGESFDPPRECIDIYKDVGVALVIRWKRSDVVYVKTLEWIVVGACEGMRPDEDFSRLMTWQHGHWRMNWVIVRSVIVGSLRCSLHFYNTWRPTMELCTFSLSFAGMRFLHKRDKKSTDRQTGLETYPGFFTQKPDNYYKLGDIAYHTWLDGKNVLRNAVLASSYLSPAPSSATSLDVIAPSDTSTWHRTTHKVQE